MNRLKIILNKNSTWKTFEKEIEPYLNQVFSIGYYYGNRAQGAFHQKPVSQYKDGKYVKTWRSRVQAARALGVDKSSIGKSVKYGIKIKGSVFKECDKHK